MTKSRLGVIREVRYGEEQEEEIIKLQKEILWVKDMFTSLILVMV